MRKFIGFLCVAVSACALKPATAGATTVTAYCDTVIPYSFPTMYYSGSGDETGGAGTIEFTGVSGNPTGFTGNYYTFCIDLIQNVYLGDSNIGGAPYTFTVTDLADAPQAGAYSPPQSGGMGTVKESELETLYQEHYAATDPGDPANGSAQDQQAFQFAIWNIIYDTDASVSSGAGSFYVENGTSISGAVTLANTWLNQAVNGTQKAFTGGQLYALVGSNNTQDQLAVFPAAVPLPAVASTGMSLLAGIGLMMFARRRQAVAV